MSLLICVNVCVYLSNVSVCKVVTLAQTHEHTLIILSKIIILAGFQDLRSSACVAELIWSCGLVIHHVLGFR